MPRPPLSYYGGKQKMARHILPIIDSIPHTVYGEPFCGGASLFFLRDARMVGESAGAPWWWGLCELQKLGHYQAIIKMVFCRISISVLRYIKQLATII